MKILLTILVLATVSLTAKAGQTTAATILKVSAPSRELLDKTKCAESAASAVKKIRAINTSEEDMKFFEIREVILTKIISGLNKENVETMTVIFGYKSGELSWENFETEVIMSESFSKKGTCSIQSYKFGY